MTSLGVQTIWSLVHGQRWTYLIPSIIYASVYNLILTRKSDVSYYQNNYKEFALVPIVSSDVTMYHMTPWKDASLITNALTWNIAILFAEKWHIFNKMDTERTIIQND